jgi:hypothetical protein
MELMLEKELSKQESIKQLEMKGPRKRNARVSIEKAGILSIECSSLRAQSPFQNHNLQPRGTLNLTMEKEESLMNLVT